jgi:hypothetical protein
MYSEELEMGVSFDAHIPMCLSCLLLHPLKRLLPKSVVHPNVVFEQLQTSYAH